MLPLEPLSSMTVEATRSPRTRSSGSGSNSQDPLRLPEQPRCAAALCDGLGAPGFGSGFANRRYFFASPTSMRWPSGSRM